VKTTGSECWLRCLPTPHITSAVTATRTFHRRQSTGTQTCRRPRVEITHNQTNKQTNHTNKTVKHASALPYSIAETQQETHRRRSVPPHSGRTTNSFAWVHTPSFGGTELLDVVLNVALMACGRNGARIEALVPPGNSDTSTSLPPATTQNTCANDKQHKLQETQCMARRRRKGKVGKGVVVAPWRAWNRAHARTHPERRDAGISPRWQR